MSTTLIYNGNVLTADGQWHKGAAILVEDSYIKEIIEEGTQLPQADVTLDAQGGYVIPGGIDMHIHGGGGHDFMDATEEAFLEIIKVHRRHGTTAMLPSLAASTHREMDEAARVCTNLMQDPANGIVGLHYEGPYFQPSMAGGQIMENLRLPDPAEYHLLVQRYPCIKRWDVSPELAGAMEMISYLAQHGIVAGLAHTIADAPVVAEAAANGCSLATHFYNAMTSVHKSGPLKHEGTVEAVFLNDNIDVEVIADGVHVPPTILKLIQRFKGTGHVALITDSTSMTDAPADAHTDPRVIISDGACMLADGSALAGSCATMDRLIRTYVKEAAVPLEEVSRMASATPARILGIDNRKGSLAPGMDADILVMDKDLYPLHVLAMGNLAQ